MGVQTSVVVRDLHNLDQDENGESWAYMNHLKNRTIELVDESYFNVKEKEESGIPRVWSEL